MASLLKKLKGSKKESGQRAESKPAMVEKKDVKKALKKKDSTAYKIVFKPLITEKATDLGYAHQYSFIVSKYASKAQIADTVRNIYGVRPVKVRTINFSGKNVRYGRFAGKRRAWKKAIISLRPEDKIEVYEGV
ncbi:MAG: 50S ribosomal protein L23 [Patescibacteria group bacterium]